MTQQSLIQTSVVSVWVYIKETNKLDCQNKFIKIHRLKVKVSLSPFTIVKTFIEITSQWQSQKLHNRVMK